MITPKVRTKLSATTPITVFMLIRDTLYNFYIYYPYWFLYFRDLIPIVPAHRSTKFPLGQPNTKILYLECDNRLQKKSQIFLILVSSILHCPFLCVAETDYRATSAIVAIMPIWRTYTTSFPPKMVSFYRIRITVKSKVKLILCSRWPL